jgi:AcrR family transcriptional regulator
LRERKKAKTKAAIQAHALRLFAEQGYQQTTVDQIAEAAEVSPSTFFRYFPTKEETVMFDRLDPVMMRSFMGQPPEMDVLTAMRAALRDVYSVLEPGTNEQELQRMQLFTSEPELRMRMADAFTQGIDMIAKGIAQRSGRAADDDAVLAMAGAITGVIYAIFMKALADGETDWAGAADRALGLVQSGLTL